MENKNLHATPWTGTELKFLEENFQRMNNNKLAAHISLIKGNLRTPLAISSRLNYLGLTRSREEKREISPVKHYAYCPCCLESGDACDCRLTGHISINQQGLNEHIKYCMKHGTFVWAENEKNDKKGEP